VTAKLEKFEVIDDAGAKAATLYNMIAENVDIRQVRILRISISVEKCLSLTNANKQ
jgi:hypothetical protein